MILFAVDPGIRHCGVAVFGFHGMRDGGGRIPHAELDRCALVRNPLTEGDGLAAQGAMARAVAEWLKRTRGADGVDALVLERQQVYTRDKSSGDPNDLLPLAGVVNGVNVLVASLALADPLPRAWKGTVKKDMTTRQVLARLTPTERARVDGIDGPWVPAKLLHNVVDAVGLGLWYLGRLRQRVIER